MKPKPYENIEIPWMEIKPEFQTEFFTIISLTPKPRYNRNKIIAFAVLNNETNELIFSMTREKADKILLSQCKDLLNQEEKKEKQEQLNDNPFL